MHHPQLWTHHCDNGSGNWHRCERRLATGNGRPLPGKFPAALCHDAPIHTAVSGRKEPALTTQNARGTRPHHFYGTGHAVEGSVVCFTGEVRVLCEVNELVIVGT